MDLRTNLDTALGDSCRILRELGGGGMSRVFLAEDIEHGREIVVKVIPAELAGQLNVERFWREIKIAARLQHPCIVPVLNSGSADGLPYYTMPLVEGESLRNRLTRDKGLAVQEAVRILRDVAGALAYAHEHGVVHRDIKPDNILVTRHHAVLLDFGVAKAISDSTRVGATLTSVGIALGTPAYMAPEQAVGDPSVDHRADIYSLGVVAYEMLAGRHPFEGRSAQSMLAAHAVEPPNSVTIHRPHLPGEISNLVMRMLEKHPGDRPQSAEEVLSALDQIATPSQGLTSSRSPDPVNTNGGTRRKRLIIASGAVGAVAMLVGLSLFAFQSNAKHPISLSAADVLVLAPAVTGEGGKPLVRESERVHDALMQNLSRVRTARLVNRPDANIASALSPSEAGQQESAGTVVTGSMYPVGDHLEVEFKLVDASTDRVIRALKPSRLPLVPGDEDLRRAIDPVLTVVGFVSEPALGIVAIPLNIPNFGAFEEFESAIRLANEADTLSIRQKIGAFRRAFVLDTGFMQARLALAWWLRSSGGIRASTNMANEFESIREYASQRRSGLTPFEQLFADATMDKMATERGINALRQLIVMSPKGPFRASLPNMLLSLNRPYAADSAFTDLLASDSSLATLPQYWLGRAALYHYVGAYTKSLDAANRARSLAPSDISAFRPVLTALAAVGDTIQFKQMLEQAAVASPNGTFFGFAGDLYLEAGRELVAHGHPVLGKQILRRAAAWFDSRSSTQLRDPSLKLRAALSYIYESRLDEAERILKTGSLYGPDPDVRFLGALGRIAALRGDTSTALKYSRMLEALQPETLSGTPTFERAQIAAELNRRDEAVSLLSDSFAQGIVFSYRARLHWFNNFMRMRDYPPFKNLITPQG